MIQMFKCQHEKKTLIVGMSSWVLGGDINTVFRATVTHKQSISGTEW